MLRICTIVIGLLFAVGASAQAPENRLKKIADTKTVRIAYRTDAPPFSFVDANKDISGFSIDLCKKVIASLARQLNTAIKIQYVPVTTQTRFDTIAKGGADMECGASTVSLSRMKVVDFSSYIFIETTGLMAKSAGAYKSLTDFEGKRIAAIKGTTNEKALNAQIARRKMNVTVVQVANSQEGMSAVDTGAADAFASDALLLIGGMLKSSDPKALSLLTDKLSYEPYGIVLPLGDHRLRLAVNTALSEIYSSDEINEIFGRWFGAFGRPTPLTEAVYILGAIPE